MAIKLSSLYIVDKVNIKFKLKKKKESKATQYYKNVPRLESANPQTVNTMLA